MQTQKNFGFQPLLERFWWVLVVFSSRLSMECNLRVNMGVWLGADSPRLCTTSWTRSRDETLLPARQKSKIYPWTAPFHATAHYRSGEWRTWHRSSKFGDNCNARTCIRLMCVHADILGSLENAFEESYDLAIQPTTRITITNTLGEIGRAMARPTRPVPAAMRYSILQKYSCWIILLFLCR